MTRLAPPIVIRPMQPEADGELNCVRKSWLKSGADSRLYRRVGKEYWPGQARRIERLMARSETIVASWVDDLDVIVGWACAEPGVVHYTWVQEPFRRQGVASALLSELQGMGMIHHGGATYSHETRASEAMGLEGRFGLRFSYYAAE